ncbi:DUF7555 family protein [Halocatena marina]|uniref:Uncharacterized protein n=1 Tax=Halocatena marina TaxID=2934937 RepID=A0ABD5YLG8_9EURY|nr:hypothetical protein [Halocatena marina]
MTTGEGVLWRRQALDAIVYAIVVTVIVVIGSIVVSFTLGGGWIGVKYILFIVGIGLFGVGTFKLRPTAPWRDSELVSTDSDRASWIQMRIEQIPPLDQYGLQPNDRISDGVKILFASILILIVSFALEVFFSVAR